MTSSQYSGTSSFYHWPAGEKTTASNSSCHSPSIYSTGERTTPTVLIAGAGLAGLFLANLLERANIPYLIFERAKSVRPLGAVMSLNANILPVFEQLGLYEELLKISYPIPGTNLVKDNMKPIAYIQIKNLKELIGYEYIVFPRPALYDMLFSRVPKEKILLGKRVMSILQNEHGVMIRCSDNQTHHGDVLVGADGAHSSVRQSLYKRLKQEGSLPSGDDSELSKGFLCMVGTTDALDPERYPCLRDPYAHFSQVIGKNSPYSWSTISVPDNKICWNVVQQLSDSMTFDDIKFRNSEWAPETNQAMIDEVKGFPITIGGTMRDLIDATPANRISKVFLEEKLFETWYSGRTVLIGDACHKLLPSAGQGAVNAMQDAVILANCLYDLESVSPESVEAALKDYRDQRYPHVKYQFDASNTNAKVIYGQTWVDRMVRHVVFNYLPKSVQTRNVAKGAGYRPQASFLPLIENRGKSPLLPQKPSRRYQEEQKRMAQLSKEQQQQEEEEEQQQ